MTQQDGQNRAIEPPPRAYLHDNQNFGDDQVIGIKADIFGGIHNWVQSHTGAVTIGIVAIVTLGLTLGLVLGLNGASKTSSNASPSPGAAPPSTVPTSSPVSQIAPMTTPVAESCTYGCLKEYLETGSCDSGCPGELCTDDNGCLDPYPCITHICCRTGCKPGWSCSSECADGLTCVSASAGTAASTCVV
ncbi:hypothetical protein F5B20DRAFT_531246 [Whalleya microplaca]|nr:hypothetical protein F5B20DRAFT_531246 [Whalleya microplaca]